MRSILAGARARIAHRHDGELGEEGVTLLEMSFSLLIMSLVMTVVVTAMSTFLYSTNSAVKMGQEDDQSALVMDMLSHQIVSANVLYNPATEGTNAGTEPAGGSLAQGTTIPAGFSLRVYTQVNGAATCVQWRVLDTGLVQDRSWNDTNPATNVTGWTTQMKGVMNPSSAPPFALSTNPSYGGRVLAVSFDVEIGTTTASEVTVATSVTARNAEFYQPNNDDTGDCTPVPSP